MRTRLSEKRERLSSLLSGNRKSETLDDQDLPILRNEANAAVIGTETSGVRMVVIPTKEEIIIVRGSAPSPPGHVVGKGVRA